MGIVAVGKPDLRTADPSYRRGWHEAIAWAKRSGHFRRLPRGASSRLEMRCGACGLRVRVADTAEFASQRARHLREDHSDALIPDLDLQVELAVVRRDRGGRR